MARTAPQTLQPQPEPVPQQNAIDLTPEQLQAEIDAARGELPSQRELRDYHAGAFQTTDPITGEPRSAPLPQAIVPTELEQAGIDAARGQLPSQLEIAAYHAGDFQTVDPVTGEPRPEPLPPLPGGGTPPTPALTGIVLIPATASLLVGGTQQFTVEALYDDSSTLDETGLAAWDVTGGTIDPAGLYTAGETPGSYNVAATFGGFTQACPVTIT